MDPNSREIRTAIQPPATHGQLGVNCGQLTVNSCESIPTSRLFRDPAGGSRIRGRLSAARLRRVSAGNSPAVRP